jgi:BirA family biotin operon repressor/biotin-[acetyl-CoA-carboxylase] ligase
VYPVRRYEELDSTNSEAARLARTGEAGPVWIVAERQTAGRGRRGRAWQGASSNLAATLLLTETSVETTQIAFIAALAVADMAAAFVDADLVKLKWPNDLLIAGAKAAGVLIEADSTPDGAAWLAIGVGANLAQAPVDTPYPATSFAAHGAAPNREDALAALDAAFEKWLRLAGREGFEPLRAAWMARANGLGELCTVSMGGRSVTGVNEGLDVDGALLLRVGAAVQRITAGDVIFGGA